MAAFGEDVVAVIERLGLERAVLIGHSMGGDVIVEAALRRPDRVAGLVWVDVYSSLGEEDSPEAIQEFLAPFRADFATSTGNMVRAMFLPSSDPALVERVVAGMSSARPEIALDALEHAFSNVEPVIAGLAELTLPVVAINPDHPPTDIDGLRRHGVTTVLMSGVGHFLMMEDPETFNRLLEETIEAFPTVAGGRSTG